MKHIVKNQFSEKFLATGLGLVAALVTSQAQASGFEKSIVIGGRSAAVGGIATPFVRGGEAVYANPGGLVSDKQGHSVTFDLSPTSSQFKGPINNLNTDETSARKTSFPLGLFYGLTPNDKWGFGVGAFVSGGAQAFFDTVDFAAATGYKPEVKTDLRIVELSAGAGYKVSDKFRVGAAWRFVMAEADFSFIRRIGGQGGLPADALLNAKVTGLKGNQALAFRMGAQYKCDEDTEFGLAWRSEVNFKATGNVSGQITSPSTALGAANPPVASADATAYTTFPMAISAGMLRKLSDEWNFLAEYTWTQYSRIGEIVLHTSSTTIGNTSVITDWRDQHNLRFGGEYLATAWPVRFGYGYTSAVTNPDYARASFVPPGPAHTWTIGSGKTFAMGENELRFDGAFEYTTSKGEVSGKADSGTSSAGSDIRNGTYTATASVAHLSLSYLF